MLYFDHVFSKRVKIQNILVNNEEIAFTRASKILLKPSMGANEITYLSIEVFLDDTLVQTTTGYHVENMLMTFTWETSTLNPVVTGFIPFLLPFVKEGCDMVFDVDSGTLRADQVYANSFYESSPPQFFGESNIGWCARELHGGYIGALYLQVLFDRKTRITSIRTGMREGKEDWIKYYHIKYMVDDIWYDYKEHGRKKLFHGSKYISDSQGWLLYPIECDGIRLYPSDSGKAIVCTKISIKGCYIPQSRGNCLSPLGMENEKIPDESLSDMSTVGSEESNTRFTRINIKSPESSIGWQGSSADEDYLQIDLGTLFKVTRIAIQAGYINALYVLDFEVHYTNWSANPTNQWKVLTDDQGKPLLMRGPEEMSYASLVTVLKLPKPIVGRSFRIVPKAFKIRKAMRVELYGCQAEFSESSGVNTGRSMLLDKTNGRLVICQDQKHNRRTCTEGELHGQFSRWKVYPSHIQRILAVDGFSNYYARTRNLAYSVRRNNTGVWKEINKREWERTVIENYPVIMAVTIPEIIPSRSFLPQLQWTFTNNLKILVSGRGVYLSDMTSGNTVTKLIALWNCCGD